MYSTVDDRVATVMLNRPQVLNCANEQWARDLNTLIDDLASNKDLRVVIVRGAGRAFCSGIDLTALAGGETGMTFFRNWEAALRKLETLDPVVIKDPARCLPRELENAPRRSPRIWILRVDVLVALGHARPVFVDGATQVEPGLVRRLGLRVCR
jgi:hypothetical protein